MEHRWVVQSYGKVARTRERCDELAGRGFHVILPDYFRGEEPEQCGPGDFACWTSEATNYQERASERCPRKLHEIMSCFVLEDCYTRVQAWCPSL